MTILSRNTGEFSTSDGFRITQYFSPLSPYCAENRDGGREKRGENPVFTWCLWHGPHPTFLLDILSFLVLLFIWGFTGLQGICCWGARLPWSRGPPPVIAGPGGIFPVMWCSHGPSSCSCALSVPCACGLWKETRWYVLAVLLVTVLQKIVPTMKKKQVSFRIIVVAAWRSTSPLLKSGQWEQNFEAENRLWRSGFSRKKTQRYTGQLSSVETQAGRW